MKSLSRFGSGRCPCAFPFVPTATRCFPYKPALLPQGRHYSHDKQKYRLEHFAPHKGERRDQSKTPQEERKEQLQHNKDKHRNPDEEKDTVLEFSLYPFGTDETSLSSYINSSVSIVHKRGLRHEVHSMGTVVEGSLDQCFEVIREVVEKCVRKGAPRLVLNFRADVSPGMSGNRLHNKQRRIGAATMNVEPMDVVL
ncbi:hypothetical protein QOT17_013851 [Balamuthia mandrillaris]